MLPIGSFEQHGTYLPRSTDTVIAVTISGELAAEYPVMQLPPITLSCSHEHSVWPGTTSISAATLFSVVNDVADSVTRSGLSALVLVNAHGGNYVLSNIVQEASAKGTRMALFPSAQDWKDARVAAQPACVAEERWTAQHNDGLHSVESSLTFEEIAEMLEELAIWADAAQNPATMREKIAAKYGIT